MSGQSAASVDVDRQDSWLPTSALSIRYRPNGLSKGGPIIKLLYRFGEKRLGMCATRYHG